MTVDFGRTAGDYGRYRQGFPAALFGRLAAMEVGLPGQRLLGLGAGTLARRFARRGCAVTGLDPAEAMMEVASRTRIAVPVRSRSAIASNPAHRES
jgi:2-polyprenyl-3-methyl-5-hydroxy-6-metoxy-1,4-benzoquinol methylase